MRNSNTLLIGKVLLEYPALPSTNQFALDLLAESRPEEGTVISTWRQTEGKGQAGSVWESEAHQNITLSVILYPSFLSGQFHFALNQAIALAVHDLVAAYVTGPVYIKWPNDIYIGEGKTAGILIQTALKGGHFQHCVAGIGINVNQTAFLERLPNPTSIALAEGCAFDLHALRNSLFLHLESRYRQLRNGASQRIREEYLQQLYRKDVPAQFRRPDGRVFEGHITGVSEQGRLLVRTEGKEEQFDVKEVSFLG